jgi:hypothetical protein
MYSSVALPSLPNFSEKDGQRQGKEKKRKREEKEKKHSTSEMLSVGHFTPDLSTAVRTRYEIWITHKDGSFLSLRYVVRPRIQWSLLHLSWSVSG